MIHPCGFKFKNSRELKLEEETLPFKFRVEIDADDDETEIVRKKSLLRLNADKVYKFMGLTVKAQEAQKEALKWLVRLMDELDIDSLDLQKEKEELIPLIQSLQSNLTTLTKIRGEKIKQAEKMEEQVSNARIRVRKNRLERKTPVKKDFFVLRLPDSNIDVPITEDTHSLADVFKELGDALLEKERLNHPPPEEEDEG